MQAIEAIEALSGFMPDNTGWLKAFEGKVFAGSAAVQFYSKDPRQVESRILKPMLVSEAGESNVNLFLYEGKQYYVLKDTTLLNHALHAQAHDKAEAYLFDDYLLAIDLMELVEIPSLGTRVHISNPRRNGNVLNRVLKLKQKQLASNERFKKQGFYAQDSSSTKYKD